MDKEEILQQFGEVTGLQDSEIDLAKTALLISAIEYPGLDVDQQLGVLDSLAEGAARRIGEERDPFVCVNNLSEYLFDEVGFQGNEADYYDPGNSYLNEVLARRLGIPITLSLVCIEVGNRLEIPLDGVGLPGHFLLRHRDQPDLIIDPFHRGILISEEECAQILRNIAGADVDWDPRYLTPVTNREFIGRMLRNLKGVYLSRQDHRRALNIVDLALILQPDAITEWRDRGLIHYQLGQYQMALNDLRYFLDSAPPGLDTSHARRLAGYIVERMED